MVVVGLPGPTTPPLQEPGFVCELRVDDEAGSLLQNGAELGSFCTSCSVTPLGLRAQVRMASVVSACESRSGPVSSMNLRVSSETALTSSVSLEAEFSKDPKSGPAPLKALNVSSSRSGIRSLGRLSTSALN